jgi:hypothetical protein
VREQRVPFAMGLGGPGAEVGRSVFVIPPEAFKAKRARVVILNDVAWSIIEAQRRKHPIWVFPRVGKPVSTLAPARNSERIMASLELAGPSVATIFAWRRHRMLITCSSCWCR